MNECSRKAAGVKKWPKSSVERGQVYFGTTNEVLRHSLEPLADHLPRHMWSCGLAERLDSTNYSAFINCYTVYLTAWFQFGSSVKVPKNSFVNGKSYTIIWEMISWPFARSSDLKRDWIDLFHICKITNVWSEKLNWIFFLHPLLNV